MEASVVKEFTWEMAHRLHLHKGLCRFIHGHSYKMQIQVTGEIQPDGMVVDFKVLKEIVNKEIVDKWDHSLMLYRKDPLSGFFLSNFRISAQTNDSLFFIEDGVKLNLVSFIPTAENMVNEVEKVLSRTLRLRKVKIWETATSFAENVR